MFRESIDAPIDPIPVEYTNSLSRINGEPDYSLTCLGVALFKSRIEGYQGFDGCYSTYINLEECVGSFLEYDENIDGKPLFCYYTFNNGNIEDEAIKDRLASKGYEVKKSIGLLIRDKASSDCLAVYHKTKNSAAIFINTRDFRLYHFAISFMSVVYPNLFKEKPLTEQEIEVVKKLTKDNKNEFVKQIQKIVEQYKSEFRRLSLGALIKKIHESRIGAAKNDLENQKIIVANAETAYSDAIKTLREIVAMYEGIVATEQCTKEEDELVNYLTENNLIRSVKIENDRLKFSVATLLSNFSEDAWNNLSRKEYIFDGNYASPNDQSYVPNILNVFRDRKNKKILLDSIFSDRPEFSVKISGNYILDLRTCRMMTEARYEYEQADPIFTDYLANPHIRLHSCLGQYKERVMKELQNGNYIVAIELCIASAASVNVDETTLTFRPFIGAILGSTRKILRRRDGVDMTPEEALIYLVDKEKVNESIENE